jgi:hypothetical protein
MEFQIQGKSYLWFLTLGGCYFEVVITGCKNEEIFNHNKYAISLLSLKFSTIANIDFLSEISVI